MKFNFFLIILIFGVSACNQHPAYKNPKLSVEERVEDLLPRMTLEEKLAGQKQIKAMESQRSQKRRSLFDAQDRVDKQREDLIATIEGKLAQKSELKKLFAIRWKLK